jgi:hypothetical protein
MPGQSGISMLEMVLYAILALIVIGIAVRMLGNLHKGAFRNQEAARLRGDADDAMLMISRDFRNLGLKRIFYSPSADVLVDTALTGIAWTPGDSSSIRHSDGNPYDTLVFIKPELNASDKPIGIDTVRYAVDPATKVLIRTRNGGAAIAVCKAVEALQFEYKVTAVKTLAVADSPPAIARWTASPAADLSASGSNLVMMKTGAGSVSAWYSNTAVQVSADHQYAIDITGSCDAEFLANVDNIVAMICDASGNPLKSERFLIDSRTTDLHLELAGIDCLNCRVGLKMVMRGSGAFRFSSFRFMDIGQGDGAWSTAPTLAQKAAVRFIRVSLLTGTQKPISGNRDEAFAFAGISPSFSDKKIRYLLQEVIPIPNNGP